IATALVLGPLAAGVAAVVVLIADQNMGYLAAALALIVLSWFVVALFIKSVQLSRGPILFCIALLTGLLTYGYFASDFMITWQLMLIGIAPVIGWAVDLLPTNRWKNWKRELLRVI